MKRYPHYIEQAAGGMWPGRVLCVDTAGVMKSAGKLTVSKTEHFGSWHAVALTSKEGCYGVVRTMSGTTEISWWDEVYKQLEAPGTLWIFSYQCSRVWAMLDLWGELENGRASFGYNPDDRNLLADGYVPDMWSESVESGDVPSAGSVRRMLDRKSGYLVLEDAPCIARLRGADGPGWVTWVDSRNYGVEVPVALKPGAAVAVWLGEWFRAMAVALKKYSMGSLQATAGSQAMHGWRVGYYTGGVHVHNDARGLDLEGKSYHGGRAEPFYLGPVDCPLWHVDFRSIYPSVCATTRLPVRFRTCVDSPSPSEAERLVRDGKAIATVAIETDEPAYPYRRVTEGEACSPAGYAMVSSPHGGGGRDVLYPVGRFVATLAGPELLDALERGRIHQWLAINSYHCSDSLRSYAVSMYEMREEAERSANDGLRQLSKRLLVCLPGKLGQREKRWVNVDKYHFDRPYGTEWGSDAKGQPMKYRCVAWQVQALTKPAWGCESVPSVASWITSAARVMLLNAIRVAGWGHVYYVDTDSLFVDGEGYANLCSAGRIKDNQLGWLTTKASSARVCIYGTKYYTENGRIVCSGLPRGAAVDTGDGLHYWYHETPTEAVRLGVQPSAVKSLRRYDRASGSAGVAGMFQGRLNPITLDEWYHGTFGVCLR